MLTKMIKSFVYCLYALLVCRKTEKYMHKHNCSMSVALEETIKQEFFIRKMTDKKIIYRFVSEREAEPILNKIRQYSREPV